MAKGGALTVTIGAAIQDFQTKMGEAQKQINQFAKDAKKSGVDLGVGASAGVTTAKAKYAELATVMKAQAERIGTISRSLAQSVSLPLAGLATGALASSTEARRILDRFGSDMKFSMGRLGTTIARDLNLEALTGSVSNFVAKAVTAFEQLPEPIRKATENLGEMLIILPLIGLAFDKVLKVGAAVVGMFGALGTKAVASATAAKAAATGWAAWGTGAATAGAAAAPAAGMAGKVGTAAQWAGPAVLTGYAMYKVGNILADLAEPVIKGPSAATSEKSAEGSALAIARAIQSGAQIPLDKFQAQLIALEKVFAANPAPTSAQTTFAQVPMAEAPGITVPRGPAIAELDEIQDKINEVLKQSGQPLIPKLFNESEEARANRLFLAIQEVTQKAKELQAAAEAKPIFGPMAATADRDLQLVDDSLAVTQGTVEDLAEASEAKIKIATAAWMKMAKEARALGPEWLQDNKYLDEQKEKIIALREQNESLKNSVADAKLDRNFAVLSDSIQITEGRLEDLADITKTKLSQVTAAWMEAREEAERLREKGIEPDIDRMNKLAEKVKETRAEFSRLGLALSGQKLTQDLEGMQRGFAAEGGGFDLNSAMRSRLIQEQESLRAEQARRQAAGMPTQNIGMAASMGFGGGTYVTDLGYQIDALGPKIENLSTVWSRFQGLVQATPPIAQQLAGVLFDMVTTFSQGVGNAIAQVLVYGQSMGKMMVQLAKQIAAQIIASLVAIGIQQLILAVIGATVAGKMASASIGASAGRAGAAAVASAFETMGLAAFFVAPALGTAAIALAAGMGGAGIAAGKAVGMTAALGGAEGGIFTQPHWVGEGRTVPEIVLNRNNIKRYFPELAGGGRSQPIYLEAPVIMDGYEVARLSAKYMPDVHRNYGTGWIG